MGEASLRRDKENHETPLFPGLTLPQEFQLLVSKEKILGVLTHLSMGNLKELKHG